MESTIKKIEEIVNEAEQMRNSYFWTPPQSAGTRRSYEKKHTHDEVTWTEGGNEYSASYSVGCSCRYIYAHGEYTRNGKKTTLTAIRNSLKRLKQQHDISEK